MEVLLVGINAKYIHPNVAIRLIQKHANHNVDLMEFTIKDNIETMVEQIQNHPADTVGFSVYIWNINIVKTLLTKIKGKTLILGGPEVSYDSEHYFDYPISYIFKGEGEIPFKQFLDGVPFKEITGLSYKENGKILSNSIVEQPLDEISFANTTNFSKDQIQYIETSRGCPYKCSFCMASLEKTVRYFSIDQVKENLETLMSLGAKTFKFLDRTFNLHIKNTISFIEYIIEHAKEGMSFQFEITGDILDQRILDIIHTAPVGLFRFEMGIQSTSDEVNLLVDRKQNTEKLFETIKYIREKDIVDLHLDLIAGLPGETLERFKQTFNETFKLGAKELQLGFLKLLPGTKLKSEQELYGYHYVDAPYEITKSNFLSESDLEVIHVVEDALEHFWNKGYMNDVVFKIANENPFEFFYQLGSSFIKEYTYQTSDLSHLFVTLNEFSNHKYQTELMMAYLNHFEIRPKRWWDKMNKKELKRLLNEYFETNPELSKYRSYASIELGNDPILTIYHQEFKLIKKMV